MTEHDIAELKHQFDQAKSKSVDADAALKLAENRLHDAMCRATGLMGKVANCRRGQRVLVHDITFMGGKPWRLKGFVLKTDGTPGMREGYAYVDSAVISDYEAKR